MTHYKEYSTSRSIFTVEVSMKFFFLLFSFLQIVAAPMSQADESREEGAAPERPLSPYFVVEEGGGGEKFPLKKSEVTVNISGIFADVTVRQLYANMGERPINARYIFPGSTRAAVQGLKMIIDEREITAKIEKREEARQSWQKAKDEGKQAALLEQQRPNVFSMDVANIMPGKEVAVELHYSELLVPESGVYEFVYPAVVGPRYVGGDAQKADNAWVANPFLKSASPAHTVFDLRVHLVGGMPIQEVSCPENRVKTTFPSKKEAVITLDPAAGFAGDRDFILRYRLSGEKIVSGLILQQAKKNEENYFLLMAQPPARVLPENVPPREYIFVVDVSGSMDGFPLDTAKGLLHDLIGALTPADRFNVLLFSSDSSLLAEESLPAVAGNIERALRFLDNPKGNGGTELLSAVDRALALKKEEGVSRSIVVVTDGYISAERELFATVEQNLGRANLFVFGIGSSVNRYLVEGLARAGQGEPFIVTGPGAAAGAARRFRNYIASPVLTDITTTCDGIELYDLEPPVQPDLFAERPVVLYGKWRGTVDENGGRCVVEGLSGTGRWRGELAAAGASVVSSGLDLLWARGRIARLDDYGQPSEEAVREITSLGLTHSLLTRYTSFVAVDEVVVNRGEAGEEVRQPLVLPKGVPESAVGGGVMHKVPEPEICVVALLAVAVTALCRRRRYGDKH